MTKPPRTERRSAPRFPARYKVRYWNDEVDGTGRTTDVSRSGIFIQTRQLPEAGTPLHLEFDVNERPFHTEGVVARVQKVSASVAPIVNSGIGVRILPWADLVDPVEAVGDEPKPGLTLDLRDRNQLRSILENEIKGGGVSVPTSAGHEIGEEVTLHLALPDPHGVTEARCRVVHRFEDPPGLGLQLPDSTTTYQHLSAILCEPLVETETPLERDTRFQITVSSGGVASVVGAVVELALPASACVDLPLGGFRVLDGAPAVTAAPVEPGPITLDLSDPTVLIRAYQQEIQNGGLFVATEMPGELGEVIVVHVTMPDPHGVVEVQGKIVHKSTNPPGLAIEILESEVIDARFGPIVAMLNR